ncbi:4'-phosphopantetheinyl transferase superfamily protein [Streptomyces sp. NPDC057426]|uniref:4'-phosphopantetheinyl transferase superfamily protein n=1 Tax=Streptomyces sp. NPDC057426 TaxID=3346128 RepID=UPI0036B47536
MPTEAVLPHGPERELLLAIHALYIDADRPGVRTIESGMQDDNDLPATMNRGTASMVLSGRQFPGRLAAIALGMFLAKQAGTDTSAARESIDRLWREADQDRRTARDSPSSGEADGPREPARSSTALDSARSDEGTNPLAEPASAPGSLLHTLYHLEDQLFPHEIESDIALMVTGPTDIRWDSFAALLKEAGSVLVVGSLEHWHPEDIESINPVLGRELQRYMDEEDPSERRRLLATRRLIRHTVAAATGLEPHQPVLATRVGGGLYVRGVDSIDISLSVQGDLAVVGLTRIGRIGVSLATAQSVSARPARELLEVLAPHEVDLLRSIPAQLRMPRLISLWVLKNAYAKAIGQGRNLSYTDFGFAEDQADAPQLVYELPSANNAAWSFAVHPTTQGHRIGSAIYDVGYGDLQTSAPPEPQEFLDADFKEWLGRLLDG